MMRGVALDAGTHRVTFRYQPASARIGAIVSVATLAAVALCSAIAGLKRLARRR